MISFFLIEASFPRCSEFLLSQNQAKSICNQAAQSTYTSVRTPQLLHGFFSNFIVQIVMVLLKKVKSSFQHASQIKLYNDVAPTHLLSLNCFFKIIQELLVQYSSLIFGSGRVKNMKELSGRYISKKSAFEFDQRYNLKDCSLLALPLRKQQVAF